MEERFRKIDSNGTKFSHYLVSNMGRVLSTWRKNSHVLKPYIVGAGYKVVKLTDDDGNEHQLYVHRLVAQAFIANPDNLPEINHKDEDKLNNRPDNLEWCDRLHNMRHGTWVERTRAMKSEKLTPVDRLVFLYVLLNSNTVKNDRNVCTGLGISATRLSSARSKLEKSGLIAMMKASDDGKAYAITQDGEKLLCTMFQ